MKWKTPRYKWLYRVVTAQLRLMPDFIIIGAARCGTTSLYSYLTAHQSIGSPCEKEVHFFDYNFGKGIAWYRAQFPLFVRRALGQRFITGESSPYYMFHPLAPKRIARMVPKAKLIVMLRNPVDRAYSHYHHTVRMGAETLSFEDAIAIEPERLDGEAEKILQDEGYYSYSHQHHSYLSRGIYVDQLEAWTGLFPREQILILRSEDFYAEPQASLRQVLEFLELPVGEPKEYRKHNSGDNPNMDTGTRKRLTDFYRPHNERLYEFLGVNFRWDQ
ncbi:MAG: sulfotransferase domain-containing protein [Anaerolineae bacterium]